MRIAFCGKMQAGKSTAAEHLSARSSFTLFKFAKAVRQVANIIKEGESPHYVTQEIIDTLHIDRKYYNGVLKVLGKIFSMRELNERVWLQELGTGFRNVIHKDFWVTIVGEDPMFKKRYEGDYNMVIDDLRFVNEAEFCKKRGFYIVKVKVSTDKQIERFKANGKMNTKVEDMNHSSEKEVAKIKADDTLNGNLPLDEYKRSVTEMFGRLYGRSK